MKRIYESPKIICINLEKNYVVTDSPYDQGGSEDG